MFLLYGRIRRCAVKEVNYQSTSHENGTNWLNLYSEAISFLFFSFSFIVIKPVVSYGNLFQNRWHTFFLVAVNNLYLSRRDSFQSSLLNFWLNFVVFNGYCRCSKNDPVKRYACKCYVLLYLISSLWSLIFYGMFSISIFMLLFHNSILP